MTFHESFIIIYGMASCVPTLFIIFISVKGTHLHASISNQNEFNNSEHTINWLMNAWTSLSELFCQLFVQVNQQKTKKMKISYNNKMHKL